MSQCRVCVCVGGGDPWGQPPPPRQRRYRTCIGNKSASIRLYDLYPCGRISKNGDLSQGPPACHIGQSDERVSWLF